MFLPNFQIFAALKKGEILYSCHVAEFFFLDCEVFGNVLKCLLYLLNCNYNQGEIGEINL